MPEYHNISDTKTAQAAVRSLAARFSIGTEQQAILVKQVADMHIKDTLVPPTRMYFYVSDAGKVYVTYGSPQERRVHVHPHALGQMCSVSGLKKLYANDLLDSFRKKEKNWRHWGPALFTNNLETLFHNREYLDRRGQPTKFLNRVVEVRGEPQLRGFVSRNFGRHLASLPLLRGFMDACEMAGAQPMEASTSDVFFSLRCFMPVPFEPVPGEVIVFGVSWCNSDFAAGRMKVSLCVMRARGGHPIILNDALSKTHIGSVLQDSDLEVSEETAEKELAAQTAVIRDVVDQQLSPEALDRTCGLIAHAADQEIPWARLKTLAGDILGKPGLEEMKKILDEGHDAIIDLPPPGRARDGTAVPTRWWAANTLAHLADKAESSERKEELKELAGKVFAA